MLAGEPTSDERFAPIRSKLSAVEILALTCSDRAATTDLQHRKLGVPLLNTPQYHGDDGKVVGRHFFLGVGVRAAAQGPHNHRAKPSGGLLLINLRVDAERLEQYTAMLQAENIDYRHAIRYYDARIAEVMRVVKADNTYTPGGESALMSSIYFFDQDGINRAFNAWLPTRAD